MFESKARIMKMFFLLVLMFFFIITGSYSQQSRWATISYLVSSGPVSPEYQYNYNILINEDGIAKLIYTKSSTTNEFDFQVSKKRLKSLNKHLEKSKVLILSSEELKSDKNLLGGSQKNMVITLWQSPDLEAKPSTIEIPSQVKSEYSKDISELYDYIENLVPQSIWEKARN